MVKTGIYTVRLTKNKKVYTSEIELKPDKLTAHSVEDRNIRYEAIMEVYGMLEHLAYMVDTMKDVETSLRDILKKEEKKLSRSTGKFLRRRADQLKETRGTVVGKSMYTRDKLQSKMIGLYSSMSRYAGKPSDSQSAYITTLKNELAKLEETFDTFVREMVPRVNVRLIKAKLPAIKVPTEEEYREKIKESA